MLDGAEFQANTMAGQLLRNRQRRERMPDHDITIRHTDRADTPPSTLAIMIDLQKETRDPATYFQLQNDLVFHLERVWIPRKIRIHKVWIRILRAIRIFAQSSRFGRQ